MYRALRVITMTALTCSAITTAAQEQGPAERVASLRTEYKLTTDHVERLIIVSKLARAGDYTHWSFVRNEAEKAIRRDEPRRWPFRIGPIRDPLPRQMRYEAAPIDTERDAYSEKIDVVPPEPEHALDVWRVIALASGAPLEDRPLLRRALQSPRILIAGNAALGLARLHDVEAADAISRAGQAAPHAQRLLFIQALVYLNDEYATRLAQVLAREKPALVSAFETLAVEHRYDPFWSAE